MRVCEICREPLLRNDEWSISVTYSQKEMRAYLPFTVINELCASCTEEIKADIYRAIKILQEKKERMPNYIKNRLTVLNRADEVFAFVKSEGSIFDFNKIVSMPECLNIPDCSAGDKGMEYLLLKENNREEEAERIERILDDNEWFEEAIRFGKQYIENIKTTGYKTWYEWSLDNWGTKWNAFRHKQIAEDCIEFETAWSGITTLIEKLSLLFPDVTFNYRYADEDTGSNCGCGEVFNGNADMFLPEHHSKEAYELSFDLWPEDREYYELKDGSYVYKEEAIGPEDERI